MYKSIINKVSTRMVVFETADSELMQTLTGCLYTLENIRHGVNNYLENKRLFFPRFVILLLIMLSTFIVILIRSRK